MTEQEDRKRESLEAARAGWGPTFALLWRRTWEPIRGAIDWFGFTPSQRERFLAGQLRDAARLASENRLRVARVERLLQYRESLGATSIDTSSIRQALYGEE